jgi:hypothetical protein
MLIWRNTEKLCKKCIIIVSLKKVHCEKNETRECRKKYPD